MSITSIKQNPCLYLKTIEAEIKINSATISEDFRKERCGKEGWFFYGKLIQWDERKGLLSVKETTVSNVRMERKRKMVRVLFVCLGNICRSPMAEAVFKHLVKEAGLEKEIEVDSAGIGDWHIGHAPHEGTRKLLDRQGISYEGMKARQVAKSDSEQFDYIIMMDAKNVKDVRRITGDSGHPKMFRMMDFALDETVRDVPDPYFTGNFEEVYEMLLKSCKHLLQQVIEEYHLSPKQ